MTRNFLKKQKLGIKLAWIGALFTAPILLLAWLFLSLTYANITFSQRELDGAAYISVIWPAFVAASAAEEKIGKIDDVLKSAIKSESQRYEAIFGTEAETAKFLAALEDGTPTSETLGEGMRLIRKITDSSNLFLDMDLDSVYLMDATMIQLPGLLASANEVHKGTHAVLGGAMNLQDSLPRLELSLGHLAGNIETLEADFQGSYSANADGTVKTALGSMVEGKLAKAESIRALAANAAKVARSGALNAGMAAAVEVAHAELVQAADSLWRLRRRK